MSQYDVDGEPQGDGLLNLNALSKATASKTPMTQEKLVAQFCNDDSIFAQINRRRKIAEDEPEKQKLITKNLWYFADKTLEETRKIWEFVTDGRWKDDYVPPNAEPREEVTFDEEEEKEADSNPRGVISDGVFNVPESLHDLLKKRMEELERKQ